MRSDHLCIIIHAGASHSCCPLVRPRGRTGRRGQVIGFEPRPAAFPMRVAAPRCFSWMRTSPARPAWQCLEAPSPSLLFRPIETTDATRGQWGEERETHKHPRTVRCRSKKRVKAATWNLDLIDTSMTPIRHAARAPVSGLSRHTHTHNTPTMLPSRSFGLRGFPHRCAAAAAIGNRGRTQLVGSCGDGALRWPCRRRAPVGWVSQAAW